MVNTYTGKEKKVCRKEKYSKIDGKWQHPRARFKADFFNSFLCLE